MIPLQLIRESMMSMETEFTATSLSPLTNYTFKVAYTESSRTIFIGSDSDWVICFPQGYCEASIRDCVVMFRPNS
jgi:hypothetical protein